MVIPTYRCQTNCVYCYAERPELPFSSGHLPVSRWVQLLTEVVILGLLSADFQRRRSADLLWGIEDLLEVAHRYRMACVLPTKSRVKRRRAERLAPLFGPSDIIQASVDSFDDEAATAMTRTPGYAGIARELIENLVAAGVRVRTNTVATPINLPTIELFIRQLREMGGACAHHELFPHALSPR